MPASVFMYISQVPENNIACRKLRRAWIRPKNDVKQGLGQCLKRMFVSPTNLRFLLRYCLCAHRTL